MDMTFLSWIFGLDVYLIFVFAYLFIKNYTNKYLYLIGFIVTFIIALFLIKIPTLNIIKFKEWKTVHIVKLSKFQTTKENGWLVKKLEPVEYLGAWIETNEGYEKIYIDMLNLNILIDNSQNNIKLEAPICEKINIILKNKENIICPNKKFNLIINNKEFLNGNYF